VSSEDKFDPQKFSDDLHERIHRGIHDRIRMRQNMRHGGALWPGVILVIIGTAILLDHMGIIPGDHLWRFWPVILIVAGVVKFSEGCNRLVAVIMMGFGSLFLLANLGYLHFSWAELWPIILIVAGATMIWGRMSLPKLPAVESGDPNTLNASTLFGGLERRITTNNFTRGTISATFGGVELDFRSADIQGEEAVLYVEALFGGIDIVIPDRWMALYEGQSIFGGFADETRPPLPEVPGAPPRKRLIIRGQAVFGGITVKN
jgi:predicted membrane protein